MRLERLSLTDFRNYRREIFRPGTALSVLTGENGSGKTNLLEAVSLLAPGRGLRGAPLATLRRSGAAQWGVAARFADAAQSGALEIATGSDPAGSGNGAEKRVFRLNGAPARGQTQIAAHFSCVWLTPQMDRLFVESASGRRRFLDRLVMALFADHARQLAAHERSVTSRNRLLAERPGEGDWLSAVEESIARHAVAANAARLILIDRMNAQPPDNEAFPQSILRLDCMIAARLASEPAIAVEDRLRARLRESREADRASGTTSFGAHKADLHLSDRATGRPAALSSSGQQKAMLIATILAHAALIRHDRGSPPAMLLDEPLLHLDEKRREALLATLAALDGTVLLTGTDPEPFARLAGKAGFFTVSEGRITGAEG